MIRVLLLPVITVLLGFSLNLDSSELPSKNIAYPEHLTGAFTGGFGEETCRSCHFDYDLNPDGGNLTVAGIGEKASPGEPLKIQISIERENLNKSGFQLSARYPDGSQAGQFKIEENSRVMFTQAVADSLQYVQHSESGVASTETGPNSWKVIWLAPASPQDTVIFNIAANAANGDQSEFGDFIFSKEIKTVLKAAE